MTDEGNQRADDWTQIESARIGEAENLSQDDHDRIQDRSLRKGFMLWMVGILIGLLALINGGVLLLAFFDKLVLGEVTLSIWLTATLGQSYAIVRVIAVNLFPPGHWPPKNIE